MLDKIQPANEDILRWVVALLDIMGLTAFWLGLNALFNSKKVSIVMALIIKPYIFFEILDVIPEHISLYFFGGTIDEDLMSIGFAILKVALTIGTCYFIAQLASSKEKQRAESWRWVLHMATGQLFVSNDAAKCSNLSDKRNAPPEKAR